MQRLQSQTICIHECAGRELVKPHARWRTDFLCEASLFGKMKAQQLAKKPSKSYRYREHQHKDHRTVLVQVEFNTLWFTSQLSMAEIEFGSLDVNSLLRAL
jgi:hypothetical protein